ncbi:MAG: DNA recombination protein RmuC [Spirochaetales bacterium]|jgi:DNA recombination protein RmuC|nr:DNA recombination protein RmuC [Spirochaetales bacterium]
MLLALLILCSLLLVAAIIIILRLFVAKNDSGSNVLTNLIEEQSRVEKSVKDEISRNRTESIEQQSKQRTEITGNIGMLREAVQQQMAKTAGMQNNQLEHFSKQLMELTKLNDSKLESVRQTVEKKLTDIQSNNAEKLDLMRKTVDEKLQSTLEKRLGESFNMVSERLEQVHKGLGEMQTLATGVGDLKRVLTNVKSRGTWGEIQLEALLENVFTTEQYAKNVKVNPNSDEMVEFAIKLPGKSDDDHHVWLPIDAKFPREDYERLVDAQDAADPAAVEMAAKALEARIKQEAKSISTKYIVPPHTTDFGFLFLPIEGLYAEVMRRPGLLDFLQREYRVAVAGPSNLTAFLNSLQMGFRTLVIEKRSSEVWQLLGAVKSEFGKFGDLLDNTKKKLEAASKSIDTASRKTRTIERKLRKVEQVPGSKQDQLELDIEEPEEDEIPDES